MPTHLDLFSGIGGFSLAFEQYGFQTVAFSEIDAFACRVLVHHWPNVPNLGSVCEINGAAVRKRFGHIDLVTFGSPCQDLSVAGKRAGMAGERSGLFHEAIRIIRDLRPTVAVWENVPGAFSSNAGWDFAAVLDALAECGAVDIAWRVLDAQYAGVPQRRDRIFVVADFGGERAGEILSLTEGVRGHSAARGQTREDIAGCLRGGAVGGRSHGKVNGTDLMPMVVANSLNGNSGRRQIEETYIPELSTIDARDKVDRGDSQHADRLIVTHALRAEGFDASEDGTGRGTPLVPVTAPCLTQNYGKQPDNSDTNAGPMLVPLAFHENQRAETCASEGLGLLREALSAVQEVGRSFGVQAESTQPPDSKAVGYGVRRLLPIECERLQGFPDGWTAIPGAADGPRYRVLGNAVVPCVVTQIAERMALRIDGRQRRTA